jgi:hypothetical protein
MTDCPRHVRRWQDDEGLALWHKEAGKAGGEARPLGAERGRLRLTTFFLRSTPIRPRRSIGCSPFCRSRRFQPFRRISRIWPSGQRTGVRNRLPALAVGQAVEHAAGSKLLLEFRILGIVRQFRFFLSVEGIQDCRRIRRTRAQSADIRRGRPDGSCRTDRWRSRAVSASRRWSGPPRAIRRGAGQADFGQPGADRVLTGDEARAAGGAALLAVPIGEGRVGDDFGDEVERLGCCDHCSHVVASLRFDGAERIRAAVAYNCPIRRSRASLGCS